MTCATEDQEQIALMEWARYQEGAHPELRLLYHVPNGGVRSKAEAGRFRAMGVKAGVPDLCLPVARGKWHGLYIELKRVRGGKVRKSQIDWLGSLSEQGYKAIVCNGWEEAAMAIASYLGMSVSEVAEW